MIRFHVLTIFPEVFPGPLGIGVIGRAIIAGDVELHVHDLREHTEGRHRQVDDEPFGGGAGMVLKPEPLIRAVRALRRRRPRRPIDSPLAAGAALRPGRRPRTGGRSLGAAGLRPLSRGRPARPRRDRRGAVGRRLRPERWRGCRDGRDRGDGTPRGRCRRLARSHSATRRSRRARAAGSKPRCTRGPPSSRVAPSLRCSAAAIMLRYRRGGATSAREEPGCAALI